MDTDRLTSAKAATLRNPCCGRLVPDMPDDDYNDIAAPRPRRAVQAYHRVQLRDGDYRNLLP